MQKSIFIGTLQECHKQDKKSVSNGQIVAYRSGNSVQLQNLDLGQATIEFDAIKGELVIRATLNEGQMLVIQDKVGIADKKEIK